MAQNQKKTNQRRLITICGSTTFWDEMLDHAQAYSVSGWMVLFPFVNMHSEQWIAFQSSMPIVAKGIKTDLDRMHEDKIILSDAILVVNVNGYVGDSTAREIAFAQDNGIEVIWAYDDEHKDINNSTVPEESFLSVASYDSTE